MQAHLGKLVMPVGVRGHWGHSFLYLKKAIITQNCLGVFANSAFPDTSEADLDRLSTSMSGTLNKKEKVQNLLLWGVGVVTFVSSQKPQQLQKK